MGYVLCICEKPSVAVEIAKVVGATNKKSGYFEGGSYLVTWAVGHLVGQAEPEEYGFVSLSQMWDGENPQYKERAKNELPIIPSEWKLVVKEETRKQYEVVKKLMLLPETDKIADWGDAGEEGHILQWFIRKKVGCRKPVERYITTSVTEQAIRTALGNPRDIRDYDKLIEATYVKKKLDWLIGMNLSRIFSINYGVNVTVGRVQTPTLYFVIDRYLKVVGFVETPFYEFEAVTVEGTKLVWRKDKQGLIELSLKDQDGRLCNKEYAVMSCSGIKDVGTGKVTSLETKKRVKDRPRLYDINELMRDGNRIYNYTADEVLKAAQSLYEKYKVATYPRTDSRYLTRDFLPFIEERIRDISTLAEYEGVANRVLGNGLLIDETVVDDAKVTDHHAIVCTDRIRGFDLKSIEDERDRNVLRLIIARILVSFSHKYVYDETMLEVTSDYKGFVFHAVGRVATLAGFKDTQASLGGEVDSSGLQDGGEVQGFSGFSLGQTVSFASVSVLDKKTVPPTYHTESSLLSAMESAGNALGDGGKILQGKGIGTQATRAEIIKNLFVRGYAKKIRTGKRDYIIPTPYGIGVMNVIPKELYSPILTAKWEERTRMIALGTLSGEQFLNEFTSWITKIVNDSKVKVVDGLDLKKLYEDGKYKVIAPCPLCGGGIVHREGKKRGSDGKAVSWDYYGCNVKGCRFYVPRKDDGNVLSKKSGRGITEKHLSDMVSGKKIKVKCNLSRGGKYTGVFGLRIKKRGDRDVVEIFEDFPKARK